MGMNMGCGCITNYDDLRLAMEEDEWTSDSDKEWWEGIIHGCYLSGTINMCEKDECEHLLEKIQYHNIRSGI